MDLHMRVAHGDVFRPAALDLGALQLDARLQRVKYAEVVERLLVLRQLGNIFVFILHFLD